MLKANKQFLYSRILFITLLFSFLIGPVVASLYNIFWTGIEIEGASILQVIRGCFLVVFCLLIYHLGFPKGGSFKLINPLFLFCLYLAGTSVFHPYPFQDFVFLFRVLYLCIVFYAAYSLTVNNSLSIRHLQIVAFIIIETKFSSQLIAFKFGIVEESYKTEYATPGFTGHSSRAANMIFTMIPVFLFIPRWTIFKTIAITMGSVACLLTMRRTALLALLLMLFVDNTIKLFDKNSSVKTRLVSIFVPIIFCMIFYGALLLTPWGQDFQMRLLDLDIRSTGTGSGRLVFQAYGLERILNRNLPEQILGDGFGYNQDYLQQKFGASIGFHSELLDIAVCAGLISLFLYFVFMINLLIFSLKIRNYQRDSFRIMITSWLMLVFVAVISGGTFDPNFALLYAIFGYTAAKYDCLIMKKLATTG